MLLSLNLRKMDCGIRMNNDIESYAKEFNIPIMDSDGIEFLKELIIENNISTILEIGSAIGYSAIAMASIDERITITTLERDTERYNIAVNNINNSVASNRITIINKDALDDIKIDGTFDLIFLDAAKSKSIEFFTLYSPYLNDKGIIVTDNINFHGLVSNIDTIKNKRTRSLMKKIIKYKEFLNNNEDYTTEIVNIGDGISLSRKK